MKEACGVFGVYAPGMRVANLTFDGLFALQHRGQESAGMAVSDGDTVTVVKDMGLVATVFDERTLSGLRGASGHRPHPLLDARLLGLGRAPSRSTGPSAGRLRPRAQRQPDQHGGAGREGRHAAGLHRHRQRRGGRVARCRPSPRPRTSSTALQAVLPILEGAFSFVLMSSERLFGVRDPYGFRPLCLGRLGPAEAPEGWVLASETPALSVIGATFVREVAPGRDGRDRRRRPHEPARSRGCATSSRACASSSSPTSPDPTAASTAARSTRPDAAWASCWPLQAPAEADMVMGVPESGVPAAEGFARASGIPYGQGLVKNRYIGRSFIAPDQQERADAVRRKLNPLTENIAGKRLVVVDDSIVRGTTQRSVIQMLREAGAAEVHLRISSPPWRWPCFYGIDTPVARGAAGDRPHGRRDGAHPRRRLARLHHASRT